MTFEMVSRAVPIISMMSCVGFSVGLF